jgi:D-sedoheptulose 7-phosphate isomerase
LPVIEKPLIKLAEEMASRMIVGGKAVFCGNGGSAADSQHLATEFVVKLYNDRAPLPAVALTTNTSIITATANDYSFDDIFSRQVRAICGVNDLLIAISTSGNSPNIVKALAAARDMKVQTAAFLGGDGGAAARHADIAIIVPSIIPMRIQEVHITMGHVLVELVEDMIFKNDRAPSRPPV